MYEVELKFRGAEPAEFEAALARLGGVLGPVRQESDAYLGHPKRDFGQTDEAFRLRSYGDENRLTYKGPRIDASTKTRVEIELPLPPGDSYAARFLEVFALLEFPVVAVVRKRRREAIVVWEGSQIVVALDNVDDLGWFVELEILAEEADVDRARQQVRSLAERLGLTRNERRSYCEMLLEQRRT